MSDLPSLSKPPLNFLINPKTARRGKPWEIDISDLLTIFIDSISNKGNPDLRLCGTAALSSALLYRFKVETLFPYITLSHFCDEENANRIYEFLYDDVHDYYPSYLKNYNKERIDHIMQDIKQTLDKRRGN